ncbi:MAG: hypothetical protein NZ703_10235 [Gemmataceae bacterium]|nr:hypothetical protein [Gemmataceae bacterium]MCS7271453.1 hypothetical protein [Gemmataceae bacterium]MDW8242240.1 hypothetical protein [Thermogemmata sp.]
MQIHPSGSHPYAMRNLPEKAPVARPMPATAESVASQADQQAPGTAEFYQLLTALGQLPEVRADVMEAVAARLAAGELQSSQAATQTAQALLGLQNVSAKSC